VTLPRIFFASAVLAKSRGVLFQSFREFGVFLMSYYKQPSEVACGAKSLKTNQTID